VRTTFHLTTFLSGAAGNVVAGYGFVKYFARFMLWCEFGPHAGDGAVHQATSILPITTPTPHEKK